MRVELAVVGNPDFGEPADLGVPTRWVEVASYAEASDAVRAFLTAGGFGGGNWTGGAVESDGKVVASVSFNGKVWEGGHCAYNPYSETP
jgi:hypothetical protein